MAEKHQIAVVLGTPSAAPPAVDVKVSRDAAHDGGWPQRRHGNRQQFDWSNAKVPRAGPAKMANRWHFALATI